MHKVLLILFFSSYIYSVDSVLTANELISKNLYFTQNTNTGVEEVSSKGKIIRGKNSIEISIDYPSKEKYLIQDSTIEIYDYEFKYNSKSTKYVIPKNLDSELKKEIYSHSEKSFKLLNCKGIARVDFRLEHGSKKVFLLEINTQPGLTENSLFPKIAKNSGLEFPELVEWIINDAGLNR